VLNGCATYSDIFEPIEANLAQGKYEKALGLLEKTKGPDRDRVLYLMNKGMLLSFAGKFKESNEAFEQAKSISRELEAISVSEQAKAASINDAMRSYAGEPYERVLLRLYKIFNYLQLNDPDSARIEALQIDVLLKELDKDEYNILPFARYVNGMVFEALGEPDEALISYRLAYKAYEAKKDRYRAVTPQQLKLDLLRLTRKLDFTNEYEDFKAEFALSEEELERIEEYTSDKGELVLFFHNNLAPIKREKAIHTQTMEGFMVRISMPYYQQRAQRVQTIQFDHNGQKFNFELGEDIEGVALSTLDEESPKIMARAIARAIVKYKAAKKVSENSGGLMGLAMNITTTLSERADTRSWSTLPHEIDFLRVPMAPGNYDIKLELLDIGDNPVDHIELHDVVITDGDMTFQSIHWIDPNSRRLKR
jgi:hypothetical protein